MSCRALQGRRGARTARLSGSSGSGARARRSAAAGRVTRVRGAGTAVRALTGNVVLPAQGQGHPTGPLRPCVSSPRAASGSAAVLAGEPPERPARRRGVSSSSRLPPPPRYSVSVHDVPSRLRPSTGLIDRGSSGPTPPEVAEREGVTSSLWSSGPGSSTSTTASTADLGFCSSATSCAHSGLGLGGSGGRVTQGLRRRGDGTGTSRTPRRHTPGLKRFRR